MQLVTWWHLFKFQQYFRVIEMMIISLWERTPSLNSYSAQQILVEYRKVQLFSLAADATESL